jgi:hypothetical protein
MPSPRPEPQPPFPADFLDRAQAVPCRRTAPAHLRQRARLACLSAADPVLSHPVAGAACQTDPDTVRKWRRRWAAGDLSPAAGPGGGGSRPFPPSRPGGRPGPGL